jgi:actin-like ATPase involved in cell morphogenesis
MTGATTLPTDPQPVTGAIAVDMGTARTKVSDGTQAPLIDEPTLLSRDRHGAVHVGWDAWVTSIEQHDDTALHSPISRALVTDPARCAEFLRALLAKVRRPEDGPVAVAIPAAAGSHQARLLRAAVRSATGGVVVPVDTLVAGAIGAGLPMEEPGGVLICDVGVGIVEIGVVRSWRHDAPALIARASADVGVHDYEDDPRFFLGAVASAFDLVRAQLPEPAMLRAPGRWLHLIGGGALVSGLAEDLTLTLKLPVSVPFHPRHAVLNGLGQALEGRAQHSSTRIAGRSY